MEISVADVTAAGYDNSDGTSGITTIRVKHGTYTWSCRPLADPGKDCGNSAGESPVFAGDLRGSGNTVWFVYRPDLTAKLTGCLLPASGTLAGHCLPGDPYRLTWSLKGNTLLRTDLYAGWPNAQGSHWPPPLSFLSAPRRRHAIGAAIETPSSSSVRPATCTRAGCLTAGSQP